MPRAQSAPKTPEGIEHKAKQLEFRQVLGSLRGYGCKTIFQCRWVPASRLTELNLLLQVIEREVRANYREYQLSYGSKHPVKVVPTPKLKRWKDA